MSTSTIQRYRTPFAAALAAWMDREHLDMGRAAAKLDLPPGVLTGWLIHGFVPSEDEITAVLERIARELDGKLL